VTRRLAGGRSQDDGLSVVDDVELDGGPAGASGTPEAEVPEREHVFDSLPPGLTTLDVVDLSFDAMQDLVTRYRHATFPPDLVVTVPKNACRTLDFHKAAEMVELGRQRAEEALESARGFPPATPRSSG